MPSPPARDAPPETPVPEQPAPQTGRPPEIEAERLDDRPARPEGTAGALRIVTVRVGGSSSWRREDIYGPDGR